MSLLSGLVPARDLMDLAKDAMQLAERAVTALERLAYATEFLAEDKGYLIPGPVKQTEVNR